MSCVINTTAVVFGSAKNAALLYDHVAAVEQSWMFDKQAFKDEDKKTQDHELLQGILARQNLYPYHLIKDAKGSMLNTTLDFSLGSYKDVMPISEQDQSFLLTEYCDPYRAKSSGAERGGFRIIPAKGSLYRDKPTTFVDAYGIGSESEFHKKWHGTVDLLIDSRAVEIIHEKTELKLDDSCIMATVASIPELDASGCTWEHILEFRKDEQAVNKLRRLRVALREDCSGLSNSELEDKLLSILEDYESTAKSWGIQYALKNFSMLCGAGALPAFLTAINGAASGGVSTPVVIGSFAFAGLAFEFARTGISHNSKFQSLPYAYLYDVKKRINK